MPVKWRLWLFLGAVASVLVVESIASALSWHSESEAAQLKYETSHEVLTATRMEQRTLEARVAALRTRTEFVELGARTEYRLIRPGERLEVLHETVPASSDAPQEPTTP